ncbi:MAG: B12-binding domain-containing radical SAM protein [Planctomycetota bacterium]|jgi:radical SAM superfamily enzyme YgiQ (UPF0313 family)
MKILFVSPESPDTFWSLKNTLKFISKKSTFPPLGLLTVASMLPEQWEKKLVDLSINKLYDDDILWADYVFVTGMYIQRESVRRIIDRCKELGAKVVAGGPIFTSMPEFHEKVDHLILNEAELTLPRFLQDLQDGKPEHVYESNGFADMSESPKPLWELVDINNYASACIQYSRGCPFNCDFCDVTTLFGHKMRTKTKEQILEELEGLYAIGWRDMVFFVDDNFIGNKQKLKQEILPAVIEWMAEHKYPFAFTTQVSINLSDDPELMDMMTRAGFDCVFVGIETTDEMSLTECNKVQNKSRNLVECVKSIQKAGMQVQAGFILGFDNDKPTIFENLISFIQNSGIVTAMVGLLNAPKGSKLYKRLVEENRLTNYATGDNTDLTINFIPAMDIDELTEGYSKVVKTIYSHKFYHERVLTFLRNYKASNNRKTKIRLHDLKVLLRSVWHIGIISKGRTYFWRLFFWSLRHPRHLPVVVTLAISGFHFKKVFESFGEV